MPCASCLRSTALLAGFGASADATATTKQARIRAMATAGVTRRGSGLIANLRRRNPTRGHLRTGGISVRGSRSASSDFRSQCLLVSYMPLAREQRRVDARRTAKPRLACEGQQPLIRARLIQVRGWVLDTKTVPALDERLRGSTPPPSLGIGQVGRPRGNRVHARGNEGRRAHRAAERLHLSIRRLRARAETGRRRRRAPPRFVGERRLQGRAAPSSY